MIEKKYPDDLKNKKSVINMGKLEVSSNIIAGSISHEQAMLKDIHAPSVDLSEAPL